MHQLTPHLAPNPLPQQHNSAALGLGLGYSYFGARYYDPDLSVWLSVDPLSEERPSHSPYNYCQWNPVMLTDPTGMLDWEPDIDKKGNITYTAEKGDNATTLAAQYGILQEKAEQITGTKGNEAIKEGTIVSGSSVEKATGSDILKLNLLDKNVTDDDINKQAAFMMNHKEFEFSQDKSNWEGNIHDYFNDFNKYSSFNAGGAVLGISTKTSSRIYFEGKMRNMKVAIRGGSDGRFDPTVQGKAGVGNTNKYEVYHSDYAKYRFPLMVFYEILD